MLKFNEFTEEQRRVISNLEQQYEVWIEAERALWPMPYNLRWVESAGKRYLCEVVDRRGSTKSLGPEGDETRARFETYKTEKANWQERRDRSWARLAETCALYRSLRLPLLMRDAGDILRQADRQGLLGDKLIVVGTNAMPAYAVEAGGRLLGVPDETDDLDMTWAADEPGPDPHPVWTMLKAVDGTFTVNTERTFQARNADGFEFELLVAPSKSAGMAWLDRPRPIASLPEQEWLLMGRLVDRVVVDRDGKPARIVCPDPRFFALQKLWLSGQEKRNSLKRPKDAVQGTAILDVVRDHMLHYPMGDDFESKLPAELEGNYKAWISAGT